MNEKSSKQVLLSVLGVAILLVAVVGVSFAAYNFTNSGANTNTITTGTIAIAYNEPTNGITITDALPMSDENGKDLSNSGDATNVFEFTVSGTTTGKIEIPYEISLSEDAANTLPASDVKVYLATVASNVETEVLAPTLASNLIQATYRAGTTNKKLYTTSFDFLAAAGTSTVTYRFKMWLKSDAVVDTTARSYAVKINVDAQK